MAHGDSVSISTIRALLELVFYKDEQSRAVGSNLLLAQGELEQQLDLKSNVIETILAFLNANSLIKVLFPSKDSLKRRRYFRRLNIISTRLTRTYCVPR